MDAIHSKRREQAHVRVAIGRAPRSIASHMTVTRSFGLSRTRDITRTRTFSSSSSKQRTSLCQSFHCCNLPRDYESAIFNQEFHGQIIAVVSPAKSLVSSSHHSSTALHSACRIQESELLQDGCVSNPPDGLVSSSSGFCCLELSPLPLGPTRGTQLQDAPSEDLHDVFKHGTTVPVLRVTGMDEYC